MHRSRLAIHNHLRIVTRSDPSDRSIKCIDRGLTFTSIKWIVMRSDQSNRSIKCIDRGLQFTSNYGLWRHQISPIDQLIKCIDRGLPFASILRIVLGPSIHGWMGGERGWWKCPYPALLWAVLGCEKQQKTSRFDCYHRYICMHTKSSLNHC